MIVFESSTGWGFGRTYMLCEELRMKFLAVWVFRMNPFVRRDCDSKANILSRIVLFSHVFGDLKFALKKKTESEIPEGTTQGFSGVDQLMDQERKNFEDLQSMYN